MPDGPIPPTGWSHLLGDGQRKLKRLAVFRRHHHHWTTTPAPDHAPSRRRRRRRMCPVRIATTRAHCCSLICKVYFQDLYKQEDDDAPAREDGLILFCFLRNSSQSKRARERERQRFLLQVRNQMIRASPAELSMWLCKNISHIQV
jgi:hypothetical protein